MYFDNLNYQHRKGVWLGDKIMEIIFVFQVIVVFAISMMVAGLLVAYKGDRQIKAYRKEIGVCKKQLQVHSFVQADNFISFASRASVSVEFSVRGVVYRGWNIRVEENGFYCDLSNIGNRIFLGRLVPFKEIEWAKTLSES